MLRYTIKRLLFIIPMMLGVILLVFSLINLVPGDPGRTILGITASQEAVDAMNEELGYYDPFIVKLADYLRGVFLHFDFGESYVSGEPVLHEILINFKYTLRLTIWCTLAMAMVGIPLGILAAVKQYSAVDDVIRIGAITLNSVPSFWLSMIGILTFSLYLGLLPSNGVDTWKTGNTPSPMLLCPSSPPLEFPLAACWGAPSSSRACSPCPDLGPWP